MGEDAISAFPLGHGQMHSKFDKTAAIAAGPYPKSKKEVR